MGPVEATAPHAAELTREDIFSEKMTSFRCSAKRATLSKRVGFVGSKKLSGWKKLKSMVNKKGPVVMRMTIDPHQMVELPHFGVKLRDDLAVLPTSAGVGAVWKRKADEDGPNARSCESDVSDDRLVELEGRSGSRFGLVNRSNMN